MRKAIGLIALMLLVAGCGLKVIPLDTATIDEHILKKNYTKGEVNTVYVGESTISHQDYYVKRQNINKVRPTEDFSVTGAETAINISKDNVYLVVGTVQLEEKTYYSVFVSGTSLIGLGIKAYLLITESGEIHDKILNEYGVPIVYKYKVTPKTARFEFLTEENIDSSKGFINYELIYTGTSGDSITLLYREFTPNNLARPAFFQNLTYSSKSEFIRFKKIKIQIHQATNESITYTVIEDGL